MTDSTTLTVLLEFVGHLVGIFALMPKGNGDNGIVTLSRNRNEMNRIE